MISQRALGGQIKLGKDAQALVENDRVDAVDKLDGQGRPQRRVDLLARFRRDRLDLVRQLVEVARADVGRHDDDRVLEVDDAALRVGEAAIVEDLDSEDQRQHPQ